MEILKNILEWFIVIVLVGVYVGLGALGYAMFKAWMDS